MEQWNSFVCKCVEYANYQEVEAKPVQFVLRTNDVVRVRLTSSTTQTCVLKNLKMTIERSKRRSFLAFTFLTTSISEHLLIQSLVSIKVKK